MSETWTYLSFVLGDGDDEHFAGGCIVRGDDVVEAVKEAHRLGCNPGGDVLGGPIPEGHLPPEKYRERLLTKAEIDECWSDCVRIGDVKDELDIPADARMCQHRNVAIQPERHGGDDDA